jgi:hypothetical protein
VGQHQGAVVDQHQDRAAEGEEGPQSIREPSPVLEVAAVVAALAQPILVEEEQAVAADRSMRTEEVAEEDLRLHWTDCVDIYYTATLILQFEKHLTT